MTDSPDTSPTARAVDVGDRRHRLRWAALGAVALLAASSGVGWGLVRELDANITTDTSTAAELRSHEHERPPARVAEARNILLIGSDNRGDGNGRYGRDTGTQRSDTTILLHLAAGGESVTAVSIPRDLMVTVPACTGPDGEPTQPGFAQFNSAFQAGGPACTIRTVEKLSGIRIDHHVIVDFTGFTGLIDAVHGVEVCLKYPVKDTAAHLELPAGRQVLAGEDALGYVRARHALGDGSDTDRMDRQQQFLAALVKKVQSNGVLLNPARLYPVLDAATSSITTDAGLDSLEELYELAAALRDVPTDHVRFLTVPRRPYPPNPNRDELTQPDAAELFGSLRDDEPVEVTPERNRAGERGSDDDPASAEEVDEASAAGTASASPRPPATPPTTYRGTTADRDTCDQ
ncbi:LCP family protein [Streptomyces sp. MTZ3.1]|uniref:LCP family protein n=1 Tax=Streptomyces meridianus TaxID=2938945 RepID=A0ABT0X9L5_9ACTN|nr:LCP family protein [Streptomyces meridianus]MCM2579218.1 LCP family protein [Streptomyces meridianus]